MFLRPIRWALSAFTTLVMLYVFFFVPIGERTLFEHVRRIAATPEAQDLGHDLGTAGQRVIQTTQHEIEHGLSPVPPEAAPDAGATPPPQHLHRHSRM